MPATINFGVPAMVFDHKYPTERACLSGESRRHQSAERCGPTESFCFALRADGQLKYQNFLLRAESGPTGVGSGRTGVRAIAAVPLRARSSLRTFGPNNDLQLVGQSW